jgi:hypothetical protein
MKTILPGLLAITFLNMGCKTFDQMFSETSNIQGLNNRIVSLNINNVTIDRCKQEIPPLNIKLGSHAFSADKALLLAALMDSVYEFKGDKYKTIMNQWDLTDYFRDKDTKTGAEFVVASNEDLILLGFAGSNEIIDWMQNFRATPGTSLDFPGLIHSGMEQGFQGIKDSMEAELTKLIATKSRPIMITGHSLGGAYAILAAEYFISKNKNDSYRGPKFDVNAVYTFGQPRVGDQEFSTAVQNNLSEEYVRLYNGFDPVTHLFPRTATSIAQMKLISPTLFNFNGWKLDLATAAYTHPEGQIVRLRDSGQLPVFASTDAEAKSDTLYWTNAVDMVKKEPLNAAKIMTNHLSGQYFCSTLKYYNNHR